MVEATLLMTDTLSWNTTLPMVESSSSAEPTNWLLGDNGPQVHLNVPYTIFEIFVALVATIGNAMVVYVFRIERRLRRRTNYYIFSLAVADLFVGLFGIPFAIMAAVGLPKNLHACLFTISLLVVLCTISIFCLVAVSVDRYWAILHPMAYSRKARTRTAILIIAVCWIAGIVIGLLPLFGWHAPQHANTTTCLFVKVMRDDYLVFLYCLTIVLPAVLLVGFYAHIYRVILRQLRQIVTMNPTGPTSAARSSQSFGNLFRKLTGRASKHSDQSPLSHSRGTTAGMSPPHGGTMLRVLGAAQKREVKATQNLSIIVLFFMICWFPLYTVNCVKAFYPDWVIDEKVMLALIALSHVNSAVNPLLYAYNLQDFRAALKNLIFRLLRRPLARNNEVHRGTSAASRLQSMREKRCGHQRVYIDSPVWLRQQQVQPASNVNLSQGVGKPPAKSMSLIAEGSIELEYSCHLREPSPGGNTATGDTQDHSRGVSAGGRTVHGEGRRPKKLCITGNGSSSSEDDSMLSVNIQNIVGQFPNLESSHKLGVGVAADDCVCSGHSNSSSPRGSLESAERTVNVFTVEDAVARLSSEPTFVPEPTPKWPLGRLLSPSRRNMSPTGHTGLLHGRFNYLDVRDEVTPTTAKASAGSYVTKQVC